MHRVIEVPISKMKRLAIDSGRVREKQSAVQKRCSVDHSISFICELARTTFNFVGRNFDRVMGWDDRSSGTKAEFHWYSRRYSYIVIASRCEVFRLSESLRGRSSSGSEGAASHSSKTPIAWSGRFGDECAVLCCPSEHSSGQESRYRYLEQNPSWPL